MSRIARNNYNASFFHIMVQGLNKEYIFNKEIYIKIYENLLKRKSEKYQVNIIAYCIMSNHAHILLQVNEIEEMSKFMHSVDTEYAKFYNEQEKRVGYVYRERFKSEPIEDVRYFAKCINYIHLNPVKAKMVKFCGEYKYSSYNSYIYKNGFVNLEIVKNVLGDDYIEVLKQYNKNVNIFLDNEECDNIDDKICDFLEEKDLNLYEILESKKKLQEILIYLKEKQKIRYTMMMEKFNIGKTKLANLLKN